MIDYEIQIALTIQGFENNPAELSELLGLEPWRTAVRGERNAELDIPRRNLWILRSSPAAPDAPLSAHWENIVQTFSGKEPILRTLSESSEVIFSVIVGIGNENPILNFPKTVVAFVANCGASIDVD